MMEIIDKRQRAQGFRQRLGEAMQAAQLSRAALARAIGVDRSTVSQLLAAESARLPNAQVIGACASVLGVSADWLLSLSDLPETAAALEAHQMSLTAAPHALVDEQIFGWHVEAAGFKIRHVPAGLPDMLKTRAVLEWECRPHLGRTAAQAIAASQKRLDWMRASPSDYEIVFPIFELESFALGMGHYRDMPLALRLAQLDRLERLATQLYPGLRVYLYDRRRLFSAPLTIFGPRMAVIFSGGHYIVFRDRERVEAFSAHFDLLVREADYSARRLPAFIDQLRGDALTAADRD